jgi:hypothetical protein
MLSAPMLDAQYSGPVSPAAQAVFTRAQGLAQNGSGAAARLLVDSVIAASSSDSPVYPEALYLRAQFAAAPADAERDYRHLIVDYPLSPHVGDALLAVGHFEMARGDRAAAEMHLQRFIAENPGDSTRAQAGLDLAKLLLDDGQLSRGCAALLADTVIVPASAIELRNRLDFYVPRCQGVDTNTAAARSQPATPDSSRITARAQLGSAQPDSLKDSVPRLPRDSSPGVRASSPKTPVPDSAQSSTRDSLGDSSRLTRSSRASSASKDTGKVAPKGRATTVHYTLQIAAYTEQADAEQEATKLGHLGLDARVVGSTKPFRVRIGLYDTRAAAEAAAAALKARQITTIVIDFAGEER